MSTYAARFRADGSILLVSSSEPVWEVQEHHAQPAKQKIVEAARFMGTFTAVFLFLFVSLNAGSFWERISAQLFPGAIEEQRIALEKVTQGNMLSSVPRLPTAGPKLTSFLKVLAVAPPDNRLIIPKIGKNIPIVPVSDAALRREDFSTFEQDIQHALRFGVVHYPGTAKPGQIGNVFITGHSSYEFWDSGKYKDVFARLAQLEVGDEYAVFYEGELHTYRITEKFEVSPKDVSVLDQPNDRYMSTLMTCSPVGTNLRRFILQANEIGPNGEALSVIEHADTPVETMDWGEELVGF